MCIGQCLESFRLPSCKAKMTSTRFEIGIFDGKGDFGSWKKKMRVLLSHHKVLIALESDDRKWSPEQLARTRGKVRGLQPHFSSPG